MDAITERLQIPQLAELCKKYGVARLSMFGSALREDFSDKRDLDFVVEFGSSNGFTASSQFFGLAHDLELLYRRKVDLVERKGIKNPYFKESIEEQEVSVFAA